MRNASSLRLEARCSRMETSSWRRSEVDDRGALPLEVRGGVLSCAGDEALPPSLPAAATESARDFGLMA
jgi:hypothetical protein